MVRTLFMLPIMTAPIVVALTWRAMFNNDAGWINYFLGLLHLPQPTWLGDPRLAMPAVIISDLWTSIPFQAILLLAGSARGSPGTQGGRDVGRRQPRSRCSGT